MRSTPRSSATRSSDDDYFRARAADLKRHPRPGAARAVRRRRAKPRPPGAILFGEDIAPTRFLETDWSHGGGIALTAGSTASHVAMLARSRGVPMVVGLGAAAIAIDGVALLDAEHGSIVLEPDRRRRSRASAAPRTAIARRRALAQRFPAAPRRHEDGTAVRVQVNIADPVRCRRDRHRHLRRRRADAHRIPVRQGTACPTRRRNTPPTARCWSGPAGKPVTIRTVDAGGDKPVPGFTVEESNPFLGLRGIRLSLARPEIFRVQIRALLRAAVARQSQGDVPDDRGGRRISTRRRAVSRRRRAISRAEGVPHKMPPLGIMVEVPSVAIAPEAFAEGRLLLDRLQRPDAICDGRGARQRRRSRI